MPSGGGLAPGNGSGPFNFRRLSASLTPSTPASSISAATSPALTDAATGQEDIIMFPKVYEDAWGGADVNRTDLERARIFLLRITVMGATDQSSSSVIRAIAADQKHNRTVPGLASAIQTGIYNNRHTDFATTPLVQAVRFMLIKARVPENPFTDRSRAVLDFFFDPTLHRNLTPTLSGELVRYPYPSGRLRVCIVGGGPTGLASAISLAEKGAGKVEVHVWERRWVITEHGTVDYPADAKRRDQVVTLQDSVTSLLSPASYQALFAGRPERVWPGSVNIQIRKVEDRFLRRCQVDEFKGLIHLHAEGITREELAEGKCGDFHVLLGTDGAASWVRRSYFHGYEKERGRSYALGLAFDRGSKAGLPWSQPLNMFLTLGQTRYLLNASDHDGRGYLNMQLTEEEWDKMVSVDGQPIHFGRPACLRRPDGSIPEGFDESRVFAPSEDRNSSLWKSIEDGLKLFGFKESEVINVVRIPIVVQAVREGVHMLPLEDSRSVARPHALVAVAGDAAMTVHFWPGRGLNSGIKAGIALGDEICHALRGGRFAGLELSSMKEYNDFILKLQGREHDKRSIPILNQSGSPEMLGWLLRQAQSVPDEVALEW
jgi:2-polyprenyl-6-methoxyphenol hydroxylase-like FAD-dependent oxidoreductase